MIVAVDSGVLLHLIDPDLPARPDPTTGVRPVHCRERINHLVDTISRAGGRLVIPTPVLAEVLVKAGAAGPDWLASIAAKRTIRIAAFDQMAAVECAALSRERAGRVKGGTRAKAKFDEQIVAIAIVEGCDEIIADDGDIRKIAPRTLTVRTLAELPLPPQSDQGSLPLGEA